MLSVFSTFGVHGVESLKCGSLISLIFTLNCLPKTTVIIIYCRKEKSSDRSSEREAYEDNQEQSEIAKAAAALVESFDLSQGKHPEKTTSAKHSKISDDDEVTLPRWQQLQKIPQQDSVSTGKKSSSSNSSSSERPLSDDAIKGDSQSAAEVQQWQSVISAIGSTSSSSQGTKMETSDNVSTNNKEQPMQKVDMSFLESTIAAPLISKVVPPKEVPEGNQSLSPSSVVLDHFHADDLTRKDTEDDSFAAPGLTEPEMGSEDLFRPGITQESAECNPDISGKLLSPTSALMMVGRGGGTY